MKFTKHTEQLLEMVKKDGLNIWAMLHIFKKRSKLAPNIPDEVVQNVCNEYIMRKGKIRKDFPYFLTVLERKSRDYFAKAAIKEHEEIKKSPPVLKDIFKQLAQQ